MEVKRVMAVIFTGPAVISYRTPWAGAV